MPDVFDSIFGQPNVRDFLRASIKNDSITHAYLFIGCAGSNKTQAARAFSQALLCPKKPQGVFDAACESCDICRRISNQKHPDVHFFEPAGVSGYLIEQIRDIVSDISLAPICAQRKIYIIDRVDLLGVSAANAFLKTLEEPPDDVVLILLARTQDSVLPTILSRCQVVPFRYIPTNEAAGIVSQNTGASIEQARQAIEACGGSITRAVEFLRSPRNERLSFRTSVFRIMSDLEHADDWDVLMYARMLVEQSKAPLDVVRADQESMLAEQSDFLSKSAIHRVELRNKRQLNARTNEYLRQTIAIIGSWLRDVLMICSGSPELVVNVDVRDDLIHTAEITDPAHLSVGLRVVSRTDEAIAYNVSPETCLDALLFEVREAIYG